jgi:tRNA(fMet)-specific endonuclease VapC
MRYLLDTDTCIYIMNEQPEKVFRKAATLKPGDVGISSITFYELAFGIANSGKAASNRKRLETFVKGVPVQPFNQTCADVATQVRLELKRKGTLIGPYDLLIAAHALHLGLTLVTNNIKEFKRISRLKVENWLAE